MKIGRWLLMRLDSQTPTEVLDSFGADTNSESRIKKSREITYIWLQSGVDRKKQRESFRKMAKSMADKYLHLMPIFTRQGISRFSDILSTNVKEIAASKMEELKKQVDRIQKQKGISNQRRKEMEEEIERYFETSDTPDKTRDVRLAMLHIMFYRYVNRVPQESLFQLSEDEAGPEPSKPLKATAGMVDGANAQLWPALLLWNRNFV